MRMRILEAAKNLSVVASWMLSASLTLATGTPGEGGGRILILADAGTEAELAPESPSGHGLIIRSIEPDSMKPTTKIVTWLGVSVEEVPEALSDQLGLKPGEGVVVNYVSAESPAAGADLRKNDVLVGLDDQILVDGHQLRKLVQMHDKGDVVKLTFYRAGKKQSASAKLEKKTWAETSAVETPVAKETDGIEVNLSGLNEPLEVLAKSLDRPGADRERVKVEVQETMEQTRRAIRDALRNSRDALESQKALGNLNRELSKLAGTGVALGHDTTVVIENDGKPARTIVQTDESGCYIILAGPKKRLIARDKNGKLLFDGPIETPEQRAKVPASVWEKVQPLLMQMDRGDIEVSFAMG
jgi:serine protease Do